MAAHRRWLAPLVYLAILAWVNIYICRELFFTEYAGHMNSMHGFWMAMARLAPAGHWIKPTWWPFWYGGMPFEYTYAPLAPDLTAAYAKIAGCSVARAFHAISGFFYCLTPFALFLTAWRMTSSAGYAFVAGLAYSLVSPTELLVPDAGFRLRNVWSARRLFLAVTWDEIPHLASLSFTLLAILFLARSLQSRRWFYCFLTGIFMALAVLANAFGCIAILMAALSLAFALEVKSLRSNLLLIAGIGAASYAVISPWMPPSLLEAIRFNGSRYEGGWTTGSWAALLAVALGWLLLCFALSRWTRDWPLRFFALFAYITSSIPLLDAYAHEHFLPQPGRYKVEMEMGLVLLAVFLSRSWMERLDWKVRTAVAVLLLLAGARQVIGYRRFAKQMIRPVNISETIEYRTAKWIEDRFAEQRVMMPGSIGQWLNAFVATPNFAGGSFPTAPNWTQQAALYNVYASPKADEAITWLKAFGVQAVAVSGPNSHEYWKPYRSPQKFEGVLPILWREDDVTVYLLPQRDSSLFHVVPESAIVRDQPLYGDDLAEVRRYVAALDSPLYPQAESKWDGWNRALVQGAVSKDQVVSVQMNYHPGWHARANGNAASIFKDGLGLMAVKPRCDGPCAIELSYDGGWEYKFCYWLSGLTLAGAVAANSRVLRSRLAPSRPAGK